MSSTPSQTRQKLDFESPDDRQARLSKLLSAVSASPISSTAGTSFPPIRGDAPYHIPESDALKRARAFLPIFQNSNTDLLSRHAENPDAVNIENTDGEERIIAMDLGLGVYDIAGKEVEGLGPVVDGSDGKLASGISENGEDEEEENESEDMADERSSESSEESSSDDSESDEKDIEERGGRTTT